MTDPEPLPAGLRPSASPSAFVTPHLAGSQGNELTRLGLTVLSEAERVVAGEGVESGVDVGVLERGA